MIIIKDKDLTGCALELCHTALIWVWQCLHPSDQRCAVTFPLCNNMLHHTLSIHHGVYIQLCDSSFPRVEELCHLLTFVICGIFVLSRSYLLPSVLHGAVNPEAALPQLTAASVWAAQPGGPILLSIRSHRADWVPIARGEKQLGFTI